MLIPCAIIQYTSILWSLLITKNNLPFFHIYNLIELLYISRISFLFLKDSPFEKAIPILTTSFITLFLTKFLTDFNSLWEYSTYLRAYEGIVVIVYSSCYFINEYKKGESLHLHKTAGFWINGGLILFFSANLLLFAFSELVISQYISVSQSIWIIHSIVMILLYITFTIAFLCNRKETKS